jgi:hypothetical protein
LRTTKGLGQEQSKQIRFGQYVKHVVGEAALLVERVTPFSD